MLCAVDYLLPFNRGLPGKLRLLDGTVTDNSNHLYPTFVLFLFFWLTAVPPLLEPSQCQLQCLGGSVLEMEKKDGFNFVMGDHGTFSIFRFINYIANWIYHWFTLSFIEAFGFTLTYWFIIRPCVHFCRLLYQCKNFIILHTPSHYFLLACFKKCKQAFKGNLYLH